MKFCIAWIAFLLNVAIGAESPYRSVRDFGVSSTNTASANKEALQKAIDWAARAGAALYLDPSEDPYPIEGGIVLKQTASIIGAHGPVGRGTRHPEKRQPVGS